MRRTVLFILLLVFGLSLTMPMFGQGQYPAEKVVLWTDRSIYISGEEISFSGFITSSDPNNILSEVVYVELITPDGQKINQAKIKPRENKFEGQLAIQQDILSGYYFLRAYTKWMRNGEAENYAYVRLKMINPLTDELLEVNDSLIDPLLIKPHEQQEFADFILDKDIYLPGDKITVTRNKNSPEKIANGCLSIVPSSAMQFNKILSDTRVMEYSTIYYYPETRGITASGKVLRKKDKSPIPYHKVSLRINDQKDFISVLSDSAGKFNMALPERFENAELFLIAASINDDEVELLIDQDFCNKTVALSVPPFTIEAEEQSQVLQMAQINQLDQAYRNKKNAVSPVYENIPFYGLPNRSIVIDDFIPLDSLEMYFTDIPNAVFVKRRAGKRYFSLSGQAELQLYEPLVLVDWVPVDDTERILAMNPNRIEKIDMINEAYLHGGIIYGGLISIVTRKSDFGGLSFPESGMYLNYEFFNASDIQYNKVNEQNYPFKNTYGWLPDLLSDSLQQPLEFIAPQTKGDYVLIIQAVDNQGKDFMVSRKFKVE